MLKHLIIDSVLLNPDSIVEWAKRCRYYSQDEEYPNKPIGFNRGYSTTLLDIENNSMFNKTMNTIVDRVLDTRYYLGRISYEYNYIISAHFNFMTSEYVHQQKWKQKHKSMFTGVIFLNKNPKPDSGVVLYETSLGHPMHIIENKYNRLLLYNSGYFSAEQNGFGDSIDDSRLTLNFFVNQFSMNVKR
jgi:hypothetical protein